MQNSFRSIIATSAGALSLLCLITAGGPASGQAEPAQPPQVALAAAASEVLKGFTDRLEAGEALTPTLTDQMFEWSRRVRDAETGAAPAKEGRVRAAADHLDRVQALHKVIHGRFIARLDVSHIQ